MKNTLLFTLVTIVSTIAYVVVSRSIEETRDFR
ncbi:hypothetical protein DFR57_109104 [Saliterribacillus persicus]|uniref:Uncharacterized protein n=1 Tax=Saliterribacillus persicus TaxID=930114 RepID=A0A368XK22_9BACI|nr:hypothetical protein DFR57_109104 [Saliterribacillus persicus]